MGDVPQMEYKKNAGSSGVMEMIEKLVYDSRELMSNSKKAEREAQAAYEKLIADSNASIRALQQEVVSKTQAKVHAECDYVLKNFDVRQQSRREEVVALQQAKQIL